MGTRGGDGAGAGLTFRVDHDERGGGRGGHFKATVRHSASHASSQSLVSSAALPAVMTHFAAQYPPTTWSAE